MNPIFPVLMKPKCTVEKDVAHNHFTMEGVEPLFLFYCATQTNIPNVQYVSWYEFLFREMEIKIELEHLMDIL